VVVAMMERGLEPELRCSMAMAGERERRLAAAAQAGDDHQLVPRDVQREVF